MTYQPIKPVRTIQLQRGDLSLNMNEWGKPSDPKIFLCHGWMDTGLSWQFVVDSLAEDWHVIAPDWRGFGGSGRPSGSYWFADYYADFEAILDYFCPKQAASVVGHSMGGNILSQYAGLRPERIAQLVNIEGFGMPSVPPERLISRYQEWLNTFKKPNRLRDYEDFNALAGKLVKDNPRLGDARADFIARCWGKEVPTANGSKVSLKADPRHKDPNPVPYHREDAVNIWKKTRARSLWVAAEDTLFSDFLAKQRNAGEDYRPDEEILIGDSGHMVHLEQPSKLAEVIENFFQ